MILLNNNKNDQNYPSSSDFKEKLNKNKKRRRVEFNPLITVINIESYKKENYYGTHGAESNDDNANANKRCILCTIF